jgi:hypothetical protein
MRSFAPQLFALRAVDPKPVGYRLKVLLAGRFVGIGRYQRGSISPGRMLGHVGGLSIRALR